MRFNPDAPHAQVFGVPGVQWQQHGRYYKRDGTPVPGDPDRDREMAELRDKLTEPTLEPEVREAFRARLAAMQAVPAIEAPAPVVESVTDDTKRLKALMEQYGEEWRGPTHAKRFLEGRA